MRHDPFPRLFPPGAGARLNRALIAGGALGANIWNNPASHFDIIKAVCPQKAPPAQGYIADPSISFKSLSVKGFIGLYSCSWTMTQTWRNDSGAELEAIYTFPIAPRSIISGLSATIAGKTARGRVISTLDAEQAYENSITAGNLAIMVQKSSLGLATINLGVMAPGDRLKVSLSCAKLTPWIDDRARIILPLAVSDRYGRDDASMKAHEKISFSPRARYMASLSFVISPELDAASAVAEDSDQKIIFGSDGRSTRISMPMDRDFILDISAPAVKRNPVYIPLEKKFFIIMPRESKIKESEPISTTILLDCSGSMDGSRIALARESLLRFSSLLRPEEKFRLIRFGAILDHIGRGLRRASSFNILQLRKSLKSSYAELGATLLDEALSDAIENMPDDETSDLLLVSDGNVWKADNAIKLARKRGIRIFCVAIGDAPNSSLLENLADETGGECLRISSKKDAKNMAPILAERMRQKYDAPFSAASNEYRSPIIPKNYCFAYGDASPSSTVDSSPSIPVDSMKAWRPALDPDLDKLAASAIVEATSEPSEKLALSLKYQILTDETSLILELGHRKSSGKLPRIEYAPQMIPRDHKRIKPFEAIVFSAPEIFGAFEDNFVEIPGFSRGGKSLGEFARIWLESIYDEPILLFRDIPSEFDEIRNFLSTLRDALKIDERSLILIFAKWIAESEIPSLEIPRHARRFFASLDIGKEDELTVIDEFERWSRRSEQGF